MIWEIQSAFTGYGPIYLTTDEASLTLIYLFFSREIVLIAPFLFILFPIIKSY